MCIISLKINDTEPKHFDMNLPHYRIYQFHSDNIWWLSDIIKCLSLNIPTDYKYLFQGNFRCLKMLLSKNASSKEKDNEGQTAMHLSTRHKSPKCLALLMKQLDQGEIDDQDKNKVILSKI